MVTGCPQRNTGPGSALMVGLGRAPGRKQRRSQGPSGRSHHTHSLPFSGFTSMFLANFQSCAPIPQPSSEHPTIPSPNTTPHLHSSGCESSSLQSDAPDTGPQVLVTCWTLLRMTWEGLEQAGVLGTSPCHGHIPGNRDTGREAEGEDDGSHVGTGKQVSEMRKRPGLGLKGSW